MLVLGAMIIIRGEKKGNASAKCQLSKQRMTWEGINGVAVCFNEMVMPS